MRVANVDGSKACPDNLAMNNSVCRRDATSRGCSKVDFSVNNLSYSQVCGRIIGRRVDSLDAFISSNFSAPVYVDGISLTHGDPKEHIWTFAAANSVSRCPCNGENTAPPPEVGNDYFCDDGTLWDGNCPTTNTCCSFNNPPWFYKKLPPTMDNIEMRVCRDQSRWDEDIWIQWVEIYVQ
jgi:hypothetical protein